MEIELRDVSKHYGKTKALDRFSQVFPAGQIVSIIGLNGAGKTTLLRCLSGIVAPTHGEILCDGTPFHRERLEVRRQQMFLPDFPLLRGNMTVLEHVSLLLRIYECPADHREELILQALQDLDLLPLAEATMDRFSRGQLYKAALVGLLAVQPQVWLLDEPFASGLDPQGLAIVKQRARQHAANGGTIFYSTQILEIAEKFSDRLIVIDGGRLASVYTRQDLAAMPATGPESLESRLRQFREVPS